MAKKPKKKMTQRQWVQWNRRMLALLKRFQKVASTALRQLEEKFPDKNDR